MYNHWQSGMLRRIVRCHSDQRSHYSENEDRQNNKQRTREVRTSWGEYNLTVQWLFDTFSSPHCKAV